MRYVAGVDLGTTYSAAATASPSGVSAFDLDTRTAVIPSVVAARADGEILTGSPAERRLVLEPSRVAREFKRRLGDPTPLLLGGVPYGAEALTGYLLRSIVDAVTEREGSRPTVVGLSHPANYGDYKLGLLEEAARVADLPETVFVPEPVAAAVHYAQSEHVAPGDVVAVYDLGGGTFDASVVRRSDHGFEVIGRPDGMDRFGGIDLDAAVLGHVRRTLGDDLLGIDDGDPATISALARLRDDCRIAKEALSGDTDVEIPVMLPGLHTEVRLTRAEFEDMIRPRVRETIEVLERAISSAGVDVGDVTRVLLVGGSSRIPLVGELVRQATGRPIGVDVHPKLATALGTARTALDLLDRPAAPAPVAAPSPPSTGAGPAADRGHPGRVVPAPRPSPPDTAAPATPTPPPPDTAAPATPTPSPPDTAAPATPTPPPPDTAAPATPAPQPPDTAEPATPAPSPPDTEEPETPAPPPPDTEEPPGDIGPSPPPTSPPPEAQERGAEAPRAEPGDGDGPEPSGTGERSSARGRRWIAIPVALAVIAAAVIGGIFLFGDDGGSGGAGDAESGDRSIPVLAFYNPLFRNPEFDDGWGEWDLHGAAPPEKIGSDYYPVLGPYSTQDPAVLDQHFAWLADAGIGIVGYDWWGPESSTDVLVPLVLNAAEDHGVDIAFQLAPYDGRSVDALPGHVAYLYERHGDHPAFYRDPRATPHQHKGDRGLFFLRSPDFTGSTSVDIVPDLWLSALEAIHELPDGGVVLAESHDAVLVRDGGFDGLYNPRDPALPPFDWSATLSRDAFYVPRVLPGFEQQSPDPAGSLPREDGAVYAEQWASALGTGVEPSLVAIDSFNDWPNGTQIEPAAEGVAHETGWEYRDYGELGPEGYLELTVAHAAELGGTDFDDAEWVRVEITSTADWTEVFFTEARWLNPTENEMSGVDGSDWRTNWSGGVGAMSITVHQPLERAEAGEVVELVLEIGVIPGDGDPVLSVLQGCLGVSTFDVVRDDETIASGTGPTNCGGQSRISIPLD